MSGGGLTFGDSVSTSHDILYMTSSGTYTVEFTATANYVSIKRRSSSVDAVIEEVKVQEVSSDYYDLSYEPLVEDINSGIYSWVIVDKYCDGSFVSRNSFSSSDTFDINYNVDHNLFNPSAPVYIFKDYNFTYSVQDNSYNFDWNVTISDKSYDNNASYKYDFGFNDTNSLDGNETEIINSEDLNITTTDTEVHFIASEIPESLLDSNIYAYITIYDYDNNNL